MQWAEEGHQRLTVKAEFINANDGVVASTDLIWLQSEFNFLAGLFDRVGLQTNVRKTVGMVCRPCWESRVRAVKSYARSMTGEGRIFKEWQRKQVSCTECEKELEKRSLVMRRQNQHSVAKGGLVSEVDEADRVNNKSSTYIIAFSTRAGTRPCPVER